MRASMKKLGRDHNNGIDQYNILGEGYDNLEKKYDRFLKKKTSVARAPAALRTQMATSSRY
jgi:hypothetical protein